jgi:hypothetical protein
MDSWLQNESVKKKVNMDHGDDIEANIIQMRLIETLNCDDVFDGLIRMANDAKKKFMFLHDLNIKVTEEQMIKYIELFQFPQFLKIKTMQ